MDTIVSCFADVIIFGSLCSLKPYFYNLHQCRTYEYVNKTRFYWLNRTITG